MAAISNVTDLCQRFAPDIHEMGLVKCGAFKLKTGLVVPVYFDFRVCISYPKIIDKIARELAHRIDTQFGRDSFDHVCGVPYTALPFAVLAAQHLQKPMVLKRKEAKTYGTMNLIDGKYKPGDRCIVIEDTVTSGTSIVEVVRCLDQAGLKVVGVVALMDREQGGNLNLTRSGLEHSFLFTASGMLNALKELGHFTNEEVDKAITFLHSNPVDLSVRRHSECEKNGNANGKSENGQSADKKMDVAPPVIGRRLFEVIKMKQSNLCLAADVETCTQLLEVADLLGPYICALKTHVDSLQDDFDETIAHSLMKLAKKHNFLIIEDRKLADIGNTSRKIFSKICQWADLVTVHALPGIDQVRAMSTAISDKSCGILLIAQMTSEGNLVTREYTNSCVEMARRHPGFVAGVIALDASLIGGLQNFHMTNMFAIFTPGVNLTNKNDPVGQRYRSPEEAVRERGTDVVIVGRGILDSYDGSTESHEATVEMAKKYRDSAWAPFKECHAYELG